VGNALDAMVYSRNVTMPNADMARGVPLLKQVSFARV